MEQLTLWENKTGSILITMEDTKQRTRSFTTMNSDGTSLQAETQLI